MLLLPKKSFSPYLIVNKQHKKAAVFIKKQPKQTMKPFTANKTYLFIVIEFTLICGICIIPPIFYTHPFILPHKPVGIYAWFQFISRIFIAAFYEELLYRIYLPNRLYILFNPLIKKTNPKPPLHFSQPIKKCSISIETFAICVFAAAHLYLGFFSVLFAAVFGIITRYAYLKLTHYISWILSLSIITIAHSGWNTIVYLYLWQKSL